MLQVLHRQVRGEIMISDKRLAELIAWSRMPSDAVDALRELQELRAKASAAVLVCEKWAIHYDNKVAGTDYQSGFVEGLGVNLYDSEKDARETFSRREDGGIGYRTVKVFVYTAPLVPDVKLPEIHIQGLPSGVLQHVVKDGKLVFTFTPDNDKASAAGAVPVAECKVCGGTGVVDDGEITHYECGIPYMNGPVKCVKDCPACTAPPAQVVKRPAKQRFDECGAAEECGPIERLRFFCSLAMDTQDWLDVEPFFDALRAQAVSVPDGWKLVPVEATKDMVAYGNSATNDVYWSVIDVYGAMLAAAPSPEQVEKPATPGDGES